MALKSINPATGKILATYDELDTGTVKQKAAHAAEAQAAWRRTSFDERKDVLRNVANILVDEKEKLGRMMTEEMGKPIKQAIGEVEKCALNCRYYADEGAKLLADKPIETNADSYIRYLPIGVILSIMPWNFPFWQAFRCIAPSVMAGNAILLKHASNVPTSALALEDVLRRGGLPEGVFQTLLIGSNKVADLIRDPNVAAVTLTGSEEAGASVASVAGSVLKKCVLELGGNDPFIVLPSADLEKAVATGVLARIINNGQSCVCAKRFIVHEAIYDQFEKAFVEALSAVEIGDPMDENVELGPLANDDGLEILIDQVERSVGDGARALIGGKALGGGGYYYPATALTDITPQAAAYREEVFGPVAVLLRAENLDDAIRIANDSPYGLGSSVWTKDLSEQERAANEIEAGQTFINSMVVSDPRLPFGGVKLSGYGRELGSYGAREFTNIKTISRSRSA